MASTLKTELGIHKDTLPIIAQSRLKDFKALWKAQRHHAAVYMAGFAVEAYLKCAICTALDAEQLPKIFEYHDLESLLFYSGLMQKMANDDEVRPSFGAIKNIWRVEMRYEDPARSKIDHATCQNMDVWLNDSKKGVLPWIRRRARQRKNSSPS